MLGIVLAYLDKTTQEFGKMLDAMASCQPWRRDLLICDGASTRQEPALACQILSTSTSNTAVQSSSLLTNAECGTAVFGSLCFCAIGHSHLMASRVIV